MAIYGNFQKALQVIAEEMTQKLQEIHEAIGLLKDSSKKILLLGQAFVLYRINGVNKSLQIKSTELQTTVNLLKSLLDFLNSQREIFYKNERKHMRK
ncbi:hypothetical protein TNCT_230341 [Trichonephila clavata]|uniref:Uncharacterized protein n=1 Tax=Trichonephila clavata TaxID=2740835 RepID=A0A8X6LWK8_TRICU|nr:hypothetical protein TNCT_230341 [Trichonephila clavata]